MAFSLWPTTFVDFVTRVPAAFFNQIRNDIASAIDGVGGGTYTPSAVITINGANGIAIGADGNVGLVSCRLTGPLTCTATSSIVSTAGCVLSGTIGVTANVNVTSGTLALGSTVNVTGNVNQNSGTLTLASTVTQTTGAITVSDFTMSSTNKVKLTSRAITRVQHTQACALPTEWKALGVQALTWVNLIVGGSVNVPLRVPHGATLDTVVMKFLPSAGHGGGLPGTMPTMKVYRSDAASLLQLGSTATDATGAGSYETTHTLTVGSIATVIDRSLYRYHATLIAESGANSFVGTELYETTVTYTTTAYDED